MPNTPAKPTFSERLTRGVIQTLGALPEPVQRLIAGKPVIIDGQTLYTEVQMALRLLNALPGSDFSELPLPDARAQVDAEARIFGGRHQVEVVEELSIPTRDGSVRARRYSNRRDAHARAHAHASTNAKTNTDSHLSTNAQPAPHQDTLLYFHGGGWVVGSLESGDAVCRFIAEHTDLEVIAVDYRLAPEHPFPAGAHDAIDAYRWVRSTRPGVKVAVAGDSAGGNLSTVVCLATVGDPAGTPDYQLLFFPVTDLSTKHRSYELFSDGYFLTEKQMDWYREHYLAEASFALDPLASPLLADHDLLAKLPPAHVAVSGFDVLRDEGIAYAERLREAGVPTTLQVVEGHIHAFVNATGVGKLSAKALAESISYLKRGLAELSR